jgi:hypothetical protein
MINYKCPKCGCEKVYAKPNGRRMGVYCSDCNAWICWTTYKKMNDIYKNLDVENLNDKIAIRKILKRSGVTKMTCSKCQCLLYNSCFPKIEGQFDLVNANFCPRCGRKLI